ncbi:hypothetical protein CsSME_00005034 [Camellia sinensis var. sinensis]
METEATQTLAEIDGSLSSKRAQSQTLIPIPTDDRGFEPPDLALQAQENGAGVVGGDGGVLGDVKVIGGSSSSEDERGDEKERGGRSEGDSIVLIGDDGADGKVELDQNGISILVQVHSSLDTVNASGNENDKGSVAENGGDPGAKLMKIPGSVSKMNQKESTEGSGEHESNPNGEENDEGEDGEDLVENDGVRVKKKLGETMRLVLKIMIGMPKCKMKLHVRVAVILLLPQGERGGGGRVPRLQRIKF